MGMLMALSTFHQLGIFQERSRSCVPLRSAQEPRHEGQSVRSSKSHIVVQKSVAIGISGDVELRRRSWVSRVLEISLKISITAWRVR